jgi:hypothetical protein
VQHFPLWSQSDEDLNQTPDRNLIARYVGRRRDLLGGGTYTEQCPSRALTYAVDGEVIEPNRPSGVAVTPNSPLWVSRGVTVTLRPSQ